MPSEDILIGYPVVGHKSAGKDYACDYLKRRFAVRTYRLSDPIRAELKALGNLNPSVKEMQDHSNQRKRETKKPGLWAERVVAMAISDGGGHVSFNGIRNPGEISFLQEILGDRLVLLGITAQFDRRFLWHMSRKQGGDPLSREGFEEMDRRDRGGDDEPADGQQVDRCMELVPPANLYHNDSTKEDLHIWLNELYARTRRQPEGGK